MADRCYWCGRKIGGEGRIVSKQKIGVTGQGPALVHPSCVPEAESMARDRVQVRITPWLAGEKGCSEVLEGVKRAETEKAVLLDETNRGELWIPKSQIEKEVEL